LGSNIRDEYPVYDFFIKIEKNFWGVHRLVLILIGVFVGCDLFLVVARLPRLLQLSATELMKHL